MVCSSSPTTARSRRSPSQASSSACCSGLVSWYSSTENQRYWPRNSSATSSRRANPSPLQHADQRVLEVDPPGPLLGPLVAPEHPDEQVAGDGRGPADGLD